MTPVEFQFNYPDGRPIAGMEFVIKLPKSGFIKEADGIIMPADLTFETDEQGFALVLLAPSSSVYTVRMTTPGQSEDYDSCRKGVSYKFYVPDSAEPVRAQDLFLAPPPNSEPWDETAIRELTEAKVIAVQSAETAVTASVSAEAAAVRAEAASAGIDEDADRAERARDASEAFAIDALAARTETDADRIAAQQAALDAANAASLALIAYRKELALSDGAAGVGHVRSKLYEALKTAADWHNAQIVNIWEFAGAVTSKPDPLDPNTWDWSPATEAAHAFANTMTYGCVIRYPRAKYPHSRTITVNYPKTGLECEGSTFTFPELKTGVAWNIVKSPAFPDSNFGTAATALRGIRTVGPGWDLPVDAIRVSANGVGPTPYFDGFYASDFRHVVTLLAGGYCCHFNMFEVYRCTAALYIPEGQTNLGENMSFVGGKIHGCRKIVDLGGLDSSIHFCQVSFDFNGKDGYIQWDIKGGFVSCSNCHWEFGHVNTPMTNLGVRTEGDQVGFYWNGGTILGHGTYINTPYFAEPVGSSSIVIENHRAIGIQTALGFSPPNAQGYLVHAPQELGNTSNVIGFGSEQCLFDYGFEQTAISDLIYISGGMGTGTNRHTGQYLKLDNSGLAFSEGTKSLRVQKLIGTTSTPSTSFDIMVPARKGDRFNIRFRCLDKDGRGGGLLYAALRYGKSLGCDGNGIPLVSVLPAFTTYQFTPTTEWATFLPSVNIPGANAARCPANCDYLVIRINMNNFAGGIIPAGDGSWYSLFFDLFEIYRW